ncbi:hypothetical protein ABPG75_008835 [Micractinium tetrahymenae]
MPGEDVPAAALAHASSAAQRPGRLGEDFIVAVSRQWPTRRLQQTSLFQAGALAAAPPDRYQLWAAFDGHNGPAAARLAASAVVPAVEARLPHAALLPAGMASLAAALQEGLIRALLDLQHRIACAGMSGGCTATVVLQVDRLVTVASVGNSRCILDTGAAGPASWLQLSRDHVLAADALERQRLAGAGCHLAPLSLDGRGPAPTPSSGDGVLRLWPGGLTQSRSLGDFNLRAGEHALLPLPHIKQVLLSPSGGRLVLATDGVWSHASDALLRAMRAAPIKTAAHDVLRVLDADRDRPHSADASVIVADVLPAGTTFQALCKRQKQLQGSGSRKPLALRKALGLLARLGSGGSSPEPAAAQEPAPGAELLADFDSAALLGLAPAFEASSSGSSSPTTPQRSRSGIQRSSSSSSSSGLPRTSSRDWNAAAATLAAAVAARAAPPPPPTWCDAPKGMQLLEAVYVQADAHQVWCLARQQRRATQHTASAAAEAVAAVEGGAQAAAGASPMLQRQRQQQQQLAPASPRILQRTSAVLRVPSLPREESAASDAASDAAVSVGACKGPSPRPESALTSSRTIRGSHSAAADSFRQVLFTAGGSSDSPCLVGSASAPLPARKLQGRGEGNGQAGPEAGQLAIAASGSARALPPLPRAGSSGMWAAFAPRTPHHDW